jgi:hypothetical protein
MGIKITIKSEDAKILQILKQLGPQSFEIISLSTKSKILNMKIIWNTLIICGVLYM